MTTLMTITAGLQPLGLVFPESLLRTEAFAVLATFVAINTVMYVALAVAKMLPKVYPSDWWHGSNRRSQNRSIYPDAASGSAGTPGSATGHAGAGSGVTLVAADQRCATSDGSPDVG